MLRILHVDGDEAARVRTETALRRAGFDVCGYADGASALAAGDDDVALVLLGAHLPRHSAVATLQALRARWPQRGLPALLIDADHDPAAPAQLRAQGVDEVLSAPVDAATLLEGVRRTLARAQGGASLHARLADRVRRVELALAMPTLTVAARQRVLLEVERLRAASRAGGQRRVAEETHRLESRLRMLYGLHATDAEVRSTVARALLAVQHALDAGLDSGQVAAPGEPSPRGDAVLVIGRDAALCSDVSARLRSLGFDVHGNHTDAGVAAPLRTLAIIADGCGDIAALGMPPRSDGAPLLFISGRDDWADRLAAFRAGGDGFFAWPDDFPALLDTLDRLHDDSIAAPYRVLIVDDDEPLADYCAAVLRAAGMVVETLYRPQELLETMADFQPELLLLDLHLGECSGIEAAGVIRQAPGHEGMPIVFLSAERELPLQLAALRVGGDDFLLKPISDDHLVAAVTIRARRFRALAALMERDGLTGLLNQIRIRLRLEEMLALASRRGGPLSFALLDVDHFKQVNDRFGHPAGDRVLRTLARLLARGLRRSDIVGRYGGEEFAVILPDTTAEHARVVLEGLRTRFAAIEHEHDGQRYGVTFSGGVAEITANPHVDALVRRADEALYRAKQGGRNRIVVADAASARERIDARHLRAG